MEDGVVDVLDCGADPAWVHESTAAFREALRLSRRVEVPRYALSREPLCRDPFGEHAEWSEVVSATEVDHIVPRRVRQELELSLENLQALCKRCHSRKTKAESRGICYGARAVERLI